MLYCANLEGFGSNITMEEVLEAAGLEKLNTSQKRLEESLDILEKRSGKDLTGLSVYLALCFDLCKIIPRTMGFNINGVDLTRQKTNMAYLQKTYSAPSEVTIKPIKGFGGIYSI